TPSFLPPARRDALPVDAGPPSASWTTLSGSGYRVSNGELVPVGAGFTQELWNQGSFTRPEAYVTLPKLSTTGGDYLGLMLEKNGGNEYNLELVPYLQGA